MQTIQKLDVVKQISVSKFKSANLDYPFFVDWNVIEPLADQPH